MSTRIASSLILALLAVAIPSLQAQQVHFVDPDALGLADGTSWDDAFTDLPAALAAASEGDELRLAEGRYVTPVVDGTPQPFDVTGLTVRGGYAGAGTPWPDARAPATLQTLLDGDVNGDDGPRFTNRSDNASSVVRIEAVFFTNVPSALDGLLVRGADGGAGLRVTADGSDLSLVDCAFFDNDGSGARVQAFQMTVERCLFVDNRSTVAGGGLRASLLAVSSAPPLQVAVIDSAFERNTVDGPEAIGGGGLALDADSMRLVGSVFRANLARAGQQTPFLTVSGGGARLQVRAGAANRALVARCRFEGNQVLGASLARGGGLDLSGLGGTTTFLGLDVVASRFIDNLASSPQASMGGGCSLGEQGTLEGCVFVGNRSEGSLLGDSCGGAVSALDSELTNCTVIDNHAQDETGGVFNASSFLGSVEISNSILWGNTGATGADLAGQIGGDPIAFVLPTVCNIQGLPPDAFETNISEAPALGDVAGPDGTEGTADDGPRLLAGSPGIDAGSDARVADDVADLDQDGIVDEPTPADQAGNTRIFDDPATPNTLGVSQLVDLGAFEFGAPLALGSWIDLGAALPGALGPPRLTGSGSQLAGAPFSLEAFAARPATTAFLVLGVTELSAPFKGGTLVPSPDVILGVPIDAVGTWQVAETWPALPQGVSLWWQLWIPDTDGAQGWAASNGLVSTTP